MHINNIQTQLGLQLRGCVPLVYGQKIMDRRCNPSNMEQEATSMIVAKGIANSSKDATSFLLLAILLGTRSY